MSVEVSLCVIRIEEAVSSKETEDVHKCGPSTARHSKSGYKGRRETQEICVETLGINDMAERGEGSTKPVRRGVLEKISGKEFLQFTSGNPFVEKTNGIIHLFKEDELTGIERAALRSQTVCILAVPSTMTCNDLLAFTAPCRDEIRHVRIIKDSSPNQYMALITFRSAESVIEFYQSFNGIPFSSMEPEYCCHLVFVSRIEILPEDEGGSVAPPSHTELPTCPVCLERMDESVDGILTIMCNHAFHSNCLVKWGDTSCPVCRYVQTPEPSEDNHCLECMATESLWICLICGHVGCGRYVQGHAYQHYIDTHHCYSMQLGSNSVWDYVGDNFVHRILQNKADGKLVESGNPDVKPGEEEVKVEGLQLEFTYLLTSQLESQRMYYEDLINTLQKKANEDVTAISQDLDRTFSALNNENERTATLLKDKRALEKKLQVATNKAASLQKQLQDETQLNLALRKNQSQWQDKWKQAESQLSELAKAKEAEIQDLKEQLRDVMFYLEAEKTINESPHKDELKEGSVLVAPSTSTSGSGKPSRRGKKSH